MEPEKTRPDEAEEEYPEVDIDPVVLALDRDDFPKLSNDREGDEVAMELHGRVVAATNDTLAVEFDSARCIHGNKSMRLGGGGRFEKLESALERRGAKSPGALAAWIGRKRYGAAKMAKWSAAGRRRAE